MKSFNNLGALIADIKGVKAKHKREVKKTLKKTGEALKKEAQAMFGTYQSGWQQLAEATREHRVAHGYPADDPLLVTGALRDAVKVIIDPSGEAVFVGMEPGQMITGMTGKVHDAAETMGVHEYGSINGRIPARPIFGILETRIEKHQKAAEDQILKGLDL